MFKFFLFFSLLVLLGLTTCTPIHHTRGNFLESAQVKQLKIGKTTKAEVLNLIGPPTSYEMFIGKGWYYMGERTETVSFKKPVIKKREFFLLEFTPQDVLSAIRKFDERGIEIKPDGDKTPTYGRDPSLLGEFINNIGRYEDPGSRGGRK